MMWSCSASKVKRQTHLAAAKEVIDEDVAAETANASLDMDVGQLQVCSHVNYSVR